MTNCCSCGKYIKVNDEDWECESCGRSHHSYCSGEEGGEGGEYPSESEYSICKKCIKKHDAEQGVGEK